MRKTYDELKDDCASVGLFIGDRKALDAKPVDIDALCEAHGITRAQWDAIPNAGDYDNWLRMRGLKR